jgi:hypothetical protein
MGSRSDTGKMRPPITRVLGRQITPSRLIPPARGDRVSVAMPSRPFRHTIGIFSTLQLFNPLVRRNAMRVISWVEVTEA